MQVNKKHTDGQSDSSSIGSFLDDTDREVCSLTDRAFKSLCVAELESSYTEADPIVSPNFAHQFSGKFPQGPRNHGIKKQTFPNKGLPNTEEHSTFQQFPNNTQEGLNATMNITPSLRMKLGLPVPGLRNYKHSSKVSSLIKTFDKAENQEASTPAKQPLRNSLTKLPLICGGNMAIWGGKTILNIQRELSEFSEPLQETANASGRPELNRRQNKMDLAYHGPRGFYRQADASNLRMSSVSAVSRKVARNRTGKAKEPARKGSFLHSENSAFESWNLHHKKLEIGGPSEMTLKEGNLTYFEETPFFREACVHESKPSPPKLTAPVILEQDFSGAFPQKPLSQASLSPLPLAQMPFPPQANPKDTVSRVLTPQASDLPPAVHTIPTPPPLTPETCGPPSLQVSTPLKPSTPPQILPRATVPPEATAHIASTLTPVPQQGTVLSEKTSSSEFKPELNNLCPPWRKQKKELGGKGQTQEKASEALRMKDSSYRVPPAVPPAAETFTDESHAASSEPSSPSFSISKLLTPVLPPKQEREASEGQPFLVAPSVPEAGTPKEAEERTLYSSQNNYKSKAPSLLFNLKDIRKRVKSTYSPSPLLRVLEDKKVKEQDSIKATNTLEGSSKKMAEADETGHRPSEQTDSTTATNSLGHFIDSYLTPEDNEMSSLAAFQPNEHHVGQYSPPNSHLAGVPADLEAPVPSFHPQDLQNKDLGPSHSADTEPQVSPYLFFTPDENINEHQACPVTGTEPRGKRSTSSSDQSFVSIIDQPLHDDSFSLMQLFQKACQQESQRSKNEWSAEGKLCSKEEEEEEERKRRNTKEKQLQGHTLSTHGYHVEEKHEAQEEESKRENAAEEREVKREDKWESMDLAPEAKLEEPQTPTSPSSLKPNMFMIKDNTFKSSPVIKAVKLPLLRSLSCEEAITGSHTEAERQTFGPVRSTPSIQEVDLFLSGIRRQQDVRDAVTDRDADESRSTAGSVSCQAVGKSPLTLAEGPGGIYTREPVGEDEVANITPERSQKGLKSGEKQLPRDKEKARAGKLRRNSASQLILSFEGDLAQNRQKFPAREKANYFKNNLLSKRRGGSCVKKIISQETRSPTVSETYSHASSDVFRDTSASSDILTVSTTQSPRPNSAMQSAFTSPFSETSAASNTLQVEKIANPSSLHGGTESGKRLSALETFEQMQTSQLSGDGGSSPVVNERIQMAKTAAKPPAVPPKSEKALRRAKKLASKRQKTEARQKRLQDETPPHAGNTTTLQPVQSSLSPICLNSSLTPSESHLVRLQPAPSLSPTPSLPATTQRKLLQDPDSGEYFIVDLPVQFKTFYDPESGRYIQLSIPPSKRNLSHTPSSESAPSSCVLYPSTLPIRVASVPAQASPNQFTESASLMQRALLESASGWAQGGQYPETLGSQPYIEPAACEEADGSQYNFGKDVSLPDSSGIIAMGAIEDFAVEGVS